MRFRAALIVFLAAFVSFAQRVTKVTSVEGITEYRLENGLRLLLEPVKTSWTGNVRPTLMLLLAAVGFVLLMVCVNIASLLIARSSARTREFAIRRALGATRGRIVRQVLTESVLLSLAGGALAVLILQPTYSSLLAKMPPDIPRLAEIHSDWRMLSLALALSVVTGVLFGLAPALHTCALDPIHDLKEGGRTGGTQGVRQRRSRAVLVVLEVAISAVLLVWTGLLIRSFTVILHEHPGLNPDGLATGQIWIPLPNNPEANRYLLPPQRAVLAREVLRRLAMLPGVQKAAVGLASDVPFLSNVRNPRPFSFSGNAAGSEDRAADFGAVSPEYFAVLSIPLKKGRGFTDHDTESSPRVVVVNEAFSRKFSPHRDVIGSRLRTSAGVESEIVGLVGDVRDDGLDMPPPPRVYNSIFQNAGNTLAVFFRTRSDAGTMKEALVRTIHDVDPELPVFGVRTMNELMSASMARRRFSLFLMSALAAVALLLTSLGIYGVMAYIVGQRVQEFGIRSALGALPRDILMLAIRPGLAMTTIGVVFGFAASVIVTRLMSSLLFGVTARDPLIFGAVAVVLGIVTLAACLAPAVRATRVSPAEALRV